MNKDQSELNTLRQASRFRASPNTVYNRVDDQGVLVNMKTNQIYELNRTGAYFWELLCADYDLSNIQQLMLQEFDVTEAELNREIEALLAELKNEDLIAPYKES